MRGGWVGSDVWDKVPNKYVFFDTFPYLSLWKSKKENSEKENKASEVRKALEVATVIRRRREWTIRSLNGLTFRDKIQM